VKSQRDNVDRDLHRSSRVADEDRVLIWGVHPVEAALANRSRRVDMIWATDNAAQRLSRPIAERQLRPERVTPRDLDRRLGADTVHQGVLIEAGPLPEHELATLAEAALDRGPLIVLDQVTDPHNVGAILRSGAVFGSAGLVMTRRHSPPLAGVLAKSASGALELLPVALVQNLARAMAGLREMGVVLIGLDGAAPDLLDEVLLGDAVVGRPLALVLGAEGRGLRQLTAESCSRLCRIGTAGPIASLNVSNAAAVALNLAAMARRNTTRAKG
jgi:23S rRNA (guanosine2251-2'-O)-methyltransferase